MNACPGLQSLEQLLAGTLDEPSLDTLNEHLGGCPRCRALLDQLSDDPELRGWKSADFATGEYFRTGPGLAHLLRPAPAQKKAQVAELTFLDPPRRSGDLGCLGPYLIESELGRGGMGIVLRAYDEGLQRCVAVKVLRPELPPAARQRFVQEARAAAQVRHDHVVTIFSVANPDDSLPYFAMELLGGQSLAELIRRGELGPQRAATLVAQAAEGLAAAHAAGLVHRDVKPANLLLDPESDRVKVSDFGLVYHLTGQSADDRLTQSGALLGTPAYMSPEQAQGAATVEARTDVYGLGVTLYEALTGEVPFRGALHLVMRQVVNDEPRPPRQLNDAVPRDLETICLKALAKNPGRRYASATDLGDDLRRWLDGAPIRARPVGRLERGWRWCRRNPRIAILAVALAVALVTGVAGVAWQAWRAQENAEQAGTRAAEAEAAKALAEERRQEAERAKALAEKRRQEAETSLSEACQAVDDFFTQVSMEDLLTQPNLLPLRRRLLEKALAYHRRFLARQEDNARLQAETALAYLRVGLIAEALGRGTEAQSDLRQAIARLEEIHRREPAQLDYLIQLAKGHMHLGRLQTQSGEFSAALTSLKTAAELSEEAMRRVPNRANLYSNALACFGNLAILFQMKGQLQKALVWYDRMNTFLEELLRQKEDLALRQQWAKTLYNRAEVQLALGQSQPALEGLEKVRAQRQQWLAREPESQELAKDLARTDRLLGNALESLGRTQEAGQRLQQAVAVLEKLYQNNQAIPEYRRSLVLALLDLGPSQLRLKQPQKALLSLTRTCDLCRQTFQGELSNPMLWELRMALKNLGQVYLGIGKAHEALAPFQEVMRLLRKAGQKPDGRQQHVLGSALMDLGECLYRLGRQAEALAALQEGVALQRQAFAQQSSNPTSKRQLNRQLLHYAERLRQCGQAVRSVEVTFERRQLWPEDGSELYRAASDLALCLAEFHKKPTTSNEEQQARDRLADLAVESLREGLERLPALRRYLTTDRTLDALRSHPGFGKLLPQEK